MRTTLSLDDDVAAALTRLRKGRGGAMKDLVNEALRLGLAKLEEKKAAAKPKFTMPTISVGEVLIKNIDCVSRVLDEVEGPFRK